MKQIVFALVALSAAATVCAGDDFFSSIDVAGGGETPADSPWQTTGYLQQKMKFGLASPPAEAGFARTEPGLVQMRSDIFAELRYAASDTVNLVVSGKYEQEWTQWRGGDLRWRGNNEALWVKDAYLDATFANGLWLRAGQQLFAWGESEGLVITDVLSAQDLREPGQAELRDVREQVPALLLSAPLAGAKLSTVITWDAGGDRLADRGDPFDPYLQLDDPNRAITTRDPAKAWEAALKLDYQFNGGDLSLVLADINGNDVVIDERAAAANAALTLTQQRAQVLGVSGNRVAGSWLFKGEIGRHRGVAELSAENRHKQWRSMAGVEYAGWNDWRLSYELNSVHIDGAAGDGWRSGQVLRVQFDSFNARLSNRWWLLDINGPNGRIARWDIAYQWSDRVNLGASLVIYQNDNQRSRLYPYRDNDTLNAFIKYGF